MDKLCKSMIAVCVVAIILGFFLPWARVQSKQVGAITKMLTGKRQGSIDAVSGFRIPLMANSERAPATVASGPIGVRSRKTTTVMPRSHADLVNG